MSDLSEMVRRILGGDSWSKSLPSVSLPFRETGVHRIFVGPATLRDVDNIELRRHHSLASVIPEVKVIEIRHFRDAVVPGQAETAVRTAPRVLVHAVRPFTRKSRTSTYWKDNGWVQRDGAVIGYYRAAGRQYRGCVEARDSIIDPLRFYIYAPPAEILAGPHSACFHRRMPPHLRRYWIHFSEDPPDIDSGIVQIERDLSEALNGS